ncbi:MAG: 4a-hydroxytetrahydrobiopterin dehydratase [Acidobacteriaceae bacterium]|nr:4a-hydroxytetrahydrobiopterin dehydratase [Acidobacteriaceae bacterium]
MPASNMLKAQQEAGMPLLSKPEIETLLKSQPGWKLEDGKLVRDWSFRDFAEAISFVNQVAQVAESAGHHPDIDIRYNRVRLALVSHDAGGVTDRDALMVSNLNKRFSLLAKS